MDYVSALVVFIVGVFVGAVTVGRYIASKYPKQYVKPQPFKFKLNYEKTPIKKTKVKKKA